MHTIHTCISLLLTQACYQKLYDGGMKGRIQYAYSKFEFSHEKYWVIDDTEVHLSTGMAVWENGKAWTYYLNPLV